jgi:cytidylate kinase
MSAGRFRVVTVAREYGSGGAAIATTLAARLGFRLLDRDLVERIATEARIDPDVAVVDESEVVDSDRVAALGARIVEEAAAVGECVVVGRGGQCLLRGRPEVFHVFVYAPREERLRRLRARLGTGVDVELLLEETDRERTAYIRRHFSTNRLDPHLYHLMVNAGLGEESAVCAILAALGTGVTGPASGP